MAAFADHPGVLNALDPSGRNHRPRATAAGVAAGAAMLLLVLLILAPIVALVIVVVDWFGQPAAPEVCIPAASIILMCTLPLLVASFVGWYRSDRRRDQFRELQSSVLGGFGLLTLLVALLRSGTQDYPDGLRWSAGIAVPALFAASFWVALVRDAVRQERAAGSRRTGSASDAGETGSATPSEPLRHVRLAVEKLSEADRAAVRQDLDAAIGELERRGIIDAATAVRARAAELGKLALRMSQGSSPR